MRKIITIFLLSMLLLNTPFVFAFGKKKTDDNSSGYKGTLPDLNKFFEYKREESLSKRNYVPEEKNIVPNKTFTNIKEAPFDDPIFMDVIIKKEKNPPFIDDVLKIRPEIIKFRDFLVNNPTNVNIQKYVAMVNVISLMSDDLNKKYFQTYSQNPCYIWIMSVSYRAKILGNLMYEAKKYSKYMTLTSGEYSKTYIDSEIKILISELDKIIYKLEELDVY